MQIIAEITDEMFGRESIPFHNQKIRYASRGIIEREDGLIAIFNKTKKNEYKLPGGGINEDETPEEAFKRETKEETGCEICDIKLLGIVKELHSLDNFEQISYIYCAKVKKMYADLALTDKEKDEGAKLLWMQKVEALNKIIDCSKNLKESEYENMYQSKFINYRDRKILEYYIEKYNIEVGI